MPRKPIPPYLARYRRPNPWPARVASVVMLALLLLAFFAIVR